MLRSTPRNIGLVLLLQIGLAVGLAVPVWGDVPRYRLQPGDHLCYEGQSQSDNRNEVYRNNVEVWVVDALEDGGWRLVMRNEMIFGESQSRVSLATVTMQPDGTSTIQTPDPFTSPDIVFPKLPPDDAAIEWTAETRSDGTIRYTLADTDEPGRRAFTAANDGPINRVYEIGASNTYHFDLERGIVMRIDSRLTQGWGFQQTTRGTMELKHFERQSAEEAAAIYEELMAVMAAEERMRQAIQALWREPDQAEKVKSETKAAFEALQTNSTSEPVKRRAAEQLEAIDSMVDYYAGEGRRFAQVLGQPAPMFDLKDLHGRAHRLEDYRGKVVLLDFWYRGCGWCIQAMPQINELVDHYSDAPVAVLGVNTDRVLDDALFVEKVMELKYPSLQGPEVPAKYQVRGFPTLILIDTEGIVRDVHIGYSPDLRDSLIEEIDRLLQAVAVTTP